MGQLAIRELVPSAGHYVSFIKSHGRWLFFDDEQVEAIHESAVQMAFGSPSEYNSSSMDHGYILMYNRDDPQTIEGNKSASSTPVSLLSKRLPSL